MNQPTNTDKDQKDQIGWSEQRVIDGRPMVFLLIGRCQAGQWRFCERSIWDIDWSEVPAAPELIARAEQEMAKKKP